MVKLLVVEDSAIVRGVFKKFLDETEGFEYDLASSYEEAKTLLSQKEYEYGVVERILEDAPKGEIIALLNKHNIAPLVFTTEIDEEFFERFEGANIVDYMIKQKYNNVTAVIEKLKQLQVNSQITMLVVSNSALHTSYLKQNLSLHRFKVLCAKDSKEAYEKIDLHPEISLMILDDKEPYMVALEIVNYVRKFKKSSELRIVALSDETNSYAISTLLNNGVDDYIIKPFSRTELYVRVYQNINNLC